jgi:hypothetical protein
LKELNLQQTDPTEVAQDNKSTIVMALAGGNFKRTKHLLCKESFVKERIESNHMKLKYIPTERMPADILTKPVSKPLLDRMLSLISII